jgi:sterol desaturase/sphingolipid hydroxylase (fatty acid hydroxylase superfamily)
MAMKKSDVSYVTWAVFVAVSSFLYSYAIWAKLNLPRYYPLEHAWKMAKVKGEISMGWYGLQGFAFLGGGVAAVIAYLLCRFCAKKLDELPAGPVKVIGIAVAVVTVSSMGYIAYHEAAKYIF